MVGISDSVMTSEDIFLAALANRTVVVNDDRCVDAF